VKVLKQAKIIAMKGRVNYDTPARVMRAVQNDLWWWLSEMEHNNDWSLQSCQWDEVIKLDASLDGVPVPRESQQVALGQGKRRIATSTTWGS